MEGRRAGPEDDAGGEGQVRSCCGRRRTPGAATSSRGRSVRHPRRLFSAERGAGGRSSRRSPDFDVSSCGRDGRGLKGLRYMHSNYIYSQMLNRSVPHTHNAQWEAKSSGCICPCAQEQGMRRISDGARGGLGGGPVRREPRTCRSRERGQHGQLAAPTVAAPT